MIEPPDIDIFVIKIVLKFLCLACRLYNADYACARPYVLSGQSRGNLQPGDGARGQLSWVNTMRKTYYQCHDSNEAMDVWSIDLTT